MKKVGLLLLFFTLFLAGCGTSKNNTTASNLEEQLDEKNRGQVPLLIKIRKLPGITLKNGVPVVVKAAASTSQYDNSEPLYVLNGQIIGNSFRSIDQIVDNFNVKKVKLLTGPDASIYGAQGAKGVIEITTYQ